MALLAAASVAATLAWLLPGADSHAEPVNVALGKPVTVDSVYDARYPASNAVDGDRRSVASRWLSARSNRLDWSQQPHWLEIDLGGMHRVVGFGFWAGAQDQYKWAPADFRFQARHEGRWEDVAVERDNREPVYRRTIEPVTCDRVRLVATRGTDRGALRLYEVEVYAMDGG